MPRETHKKNSHLLCTIGVRSGSEGIPNKNLRKLYGKPLMAYTIEQALQSELFEHIVVSTDSEEIAKWAINMTTSNRKINKIIHNSL
jgi:CMP-N-acetylneuraminic acid synthetase